MIKKEKFSFCLFSDRSQLMGFLKKSYKICISRIVFPLATSKRVYCANLKIGNID